MKENLLRKYFEKEISIDELETDLIDSQTKTGFDSISIQIEQIKDSGEFQVLINNLILLCDNVINGELKLIDLNTIAFALITSEHFTWDSDSEFGNRIETVIYDWDNSEIGFDLTIDNVKLWKEYLLTGNYKFDKELLKKKP